MHELTRIPVAHRPSQGEFTTKITRGDLINGRRGYNWEVRNSEGRLVRMGWTAGLRRDAEIEAARDVLDLCSRMTLVNEAWDDEITGVRAL